MNLRSNINTWFRYLLTDISPKLNIKFFYWYYFHKNFDLENPQTLDEKIQWMKIYYHKNNALVKQCADKLQVRDYVKSCGLEHILVPLIAKYNDASGIEWNKLPNKYVLKWNFGCGGNYVCFDNTKTDTQKVTKELNAFKKIKFHKLAAESQYDVDKVLLCEQFIDTENGLAPTDYKVYCFNGVAKYVLCCYGRTETSRPKFYFFDKEWNFHRLNKMGKMAPEGFTMPKPEGMDELFRCAEILSKPFPFVRADFYLEKGKVYFGELTFTPAGGFDTGRLPETNLLFGQMVQLPPKA